MEGGGKSAIERRSESAIERRGEGEVWFGLFFVFVFCFWEVCCELRLKFSRHLSRLTCVCQEHDMTHKANRRWHDTNDIQNCNKPRSSTHTHKKKKKPTTTTNTFSSLFFSRPSLHPSTLSDSFLLSFCFSDCCQDGAGRSWAQDQGRAVEHDKRHGH